MGAITDFLSAGGTLFGRADYQPSTIGETSTMLAPLGLWNMETGEFDGLFQPPDRPSTPQVPLSDLLKHIHKRAKLINQDYIWPWRGTLADLVCLAALAKYDRLDLLTIFHAHDIPKEHYLWFREHGVKTHCCEPMDVLPYVSVPVLSTYCGDIIFEIQKDCHPIAKEWLDGNNWDVLADQFGDLTRDLTDLGFNSIRAAGWWLRLVYTWRFNSRRLLGELCLSCNDLHLHTWNQCPDFYDDADIREWARAYALHEGSQDAVIQEYLKYKDPKLVPCTYYCPYVSGSIMFSILGGGQ